MSRETYIKADSEKLVEIVRQAESRLEAQTTLAIAADQRAMTFAGLLVTLCAALIAWTATVGLTSGAKVATWAMIAAFAAGGLCALWSARPVSWEIVGNTPVSWLDDIKEGADDLHAGRADMAAFYAVMIDRNDAALKASAKWVRAALAFTGAGLIAGVATAILG